jgi:hypothetical protein
MSEEEKMSDRPDWRDVEQYRHLLDLDRAGWAWEWLRRHRDYVGEDDDKDSRQDSRAESQPALIQRAQPDTACQWGLCFC